MLRAKEFVIGLARRIGVISLLLLAAISGGQAEQQRTIPPIPEGTSTIRGRVVDSLTKEPVAGCRVRVMASAHLAMMETDHAGTYELKNIAAGVYSFGILCPAHLPACFGTDLSRCQIELARDQERDGVDFPVVRGAIARGQVMTFDGRPVTRATVRLGRGMRGEQTGFGAPTTTDIDGRFELKNLQAGEWRLEVEIPPVPGGLRPPVVYYPGGLSWEEAGGVVLEPGKVTDRLTITVPRIFENILTVVVPPADATISNIAVSVLQESPLAVRKLELNPEGVGELKGVLPGRYFVSARATSLDKQWAAYEVVDFIEDSHETRLHLMPTGGIAGKVVADKGDLPPLAGVIAGASWIHDGAEVNPLDVDEVAVAADGSFRIENLFGTRALRLRALGLEWEVAAVRQSRTDVTSSGILVMPDTTIEATIVLRRK